MAYREFSTISPVGTPLTSGHGISGTQQPALSSRLADICFFVGGVVAALIMYRII